MLTVGAPAVTGLLMGFCWQVNEADGELHSDPAAEPPALSDSQVAVSCLTHRLATSTAASASDSKQSSSNCIAAAAGLISSWELLLLLLLAASNAAVKERTLAAAMLRSLLVLCCDMAGAGPAWPAIAAEALLAAHILLLLLVITALSCWVSPTLHVLVVCAGTQRARRPDGGSVLQQMVASVSVTFLLEAEESSLEARRAADASISHAG
jgi:hypothetical protein